MPQSLLIFLKENDSIRNLLLTDMLQYDDLETASRFLIMYIQ